MTARIVLKFTDSSQAEFFNIISFSFSKDVYVPYTSLSAKLSVSGSLCNFSGVSEICLYIGSDCVHHGLVDSIRTYTEKGIQFLTLSSRGFTSLLLQNQMEEGIISGISLNSLMDGFYTLPYITHENNSDESSYIYIKKSSSMWDGVVCLGYKLYGIYPYIRGTNCVRISAESSPESFSFTADELTSHGRSLSLRRAVSGFHMADISGEYDTYVRYDQNIADRKIIRNRFFELDRQFLYAPEEALVFHDKIANRGIVSDFCTYCGFSGEDLYDVVSFPNVSSKRIASVSISGSSQGIFTTIGVCTDDFFR